MWQRKGVKQKGKTFLALWNWCSSKLPSARSAAISKYGSRTEELGSSGLWPTFLAAQLVKHLAAVFERNRQVLEAFSLLSICQLLEKKERLYNQLYVPRLLWSREMLYSGAKNLTDSTEPTRSPCSIWELVFILTCKWTGWKMALFYFFVCYWCGFPMGGLYGGEPFEEILKGICACPPRHQSTARRELLMLQLSSLFLLGA